MLVLAKLELHLLIREKLAKGTVVEEVDEEEAAFVHLNIVAINLDFLADLIDDFLVAVLSRAHSDFVFAILVTFENINDPECH